LRIGVKDNDGSRLQGPGFTPVLCSLDAGSTDETPMTRTASLTQRQILFFWLPLAATWLMMSVEGPFLTAVIARLTEPKYNLAAFGVAFSFALLAEAPVIMMMSAATALVTDRDSYRRLRAFTHGLNGLITLALGILLVPPIFAFVTGTLMDLPAEVAERTWLALLYLMPWPATIGFRRFYQGVLIRHGQTRRVAYGTVIRLAAMSATAMVLVRHTDLAGAVVGAAALSAGVTAEAAASRVMADRAVRSLMSGPETEAAGEGLTFLGIARFYTPLALTAVLALGVHPLVTFFVGHGRLALESLAVLPVVNSLVFVFRSLGLGLHRHDAVGIGHEQYRAGQDLLAGTAAGDGLDGLHAVALAVLHGAADHAERQQQHEGQSGHGRDLESQAHRGPPSCVGGSLGRP